MVIEIDLTGRFTAVDLGLNQQNMDIYDITKTWGQPTWRMSIWQEIWPAKLLDTSGLQVNSHDFINSSKTH